MKWTVLLAVTLIGACASGSGNPEVIGGDDLPFCGDAVVSPRDIQMSEESPGVFSAAVICAESVTPAAADSSVRLQGQPPQSAQLIGAILVRKTDRLASVMPALERQARALGSNILTPDFGHPLRARGIEVFNAYFWAGDQ